MEPVQPPEQLTAPMVVLRVKELFHGDESAPAVPPRVPAVAEEATNDLAVLTFDAAKKIKVIRGRRAREEVSGYLFADLLGMEMLKTEVLRLGEAVRRAAIDAKDEETRLKNAASAKKSYLRKKAEKDAELAVRLAAEIEEIDAATAAACRDVQTAVIKPAGLPDRNTVLVESRPPPKPAPAAQLRRRCTCAPTAAPRTCAPGLARCTRWRRLRRRHWPSSPPTTSSRSAAAARTPSLMRSWPTPRSGMRTHCAG